MGRGVNAAITVFIVLILVSLALSGAGFYLLQKERVKNIDLQQRLDDVTLKQKDTEARLRTSEKLVSELQYKLQESKSKIDALDSELREEKAARSQDQARFEQARRELEQQKSLRADLENKLSLANDATKKVVEQLKGLDAKKRELESRIKELEEKGQGIELGRIIVGPEPEVPAAAPVTEISPQNALDVKPDARREDQGSAAKQEGSILVINKDYNFAVINLGSKDGVNLDDVFAVYHGNKYLGDIKIEKVHDSMSAADLVSAGIKDKVSEGDKVVRKAK